MRSFSVSAIRRPFRRLQLALLPLSILLVAAAWPRSSAAGRDIGVRIARDSQVDSIVLDREIKPWLKQYCLNCHTGAQSSAGIDLSKDNTLEAIQKSQTLWRKALVQLHERTMPPAGALQPTPDSRDRMAELLNRTLAAADEKLIPKDPGRVLLHRLSRDEYNNTVRDLFGVTIRPADKFPADGGGGGGFDNNADTLFIPAVLMERYLDAADEILDAAPKDRVFTATPSKTLPARAAAKKIIAFHASRAFRRPVRDDELARLLKLYDTAIGRRETHESAVNLALKAVLVSPSFLFRIEDDPQVGGARALNDYELASRLSYFLWSSMPDDTLFALAKSGKLHTPAVLDAQVARMLKSPRAYALSESFASQWLKVRDLYSTVAPDPGRFPEYTPALRDAMYQETILFVESVVQDNASLLTLLDSNYTFLNEPLAKHYGIPNVSGTQMRRVALTGDQRGGVLTMASVLTLSSYPQRTSPVLRGKYILSELLGTPPPPPPPVVATLSTEDKPKDGLTFRQRLEKHRTKPECAGCHARMDPLGFGLENFDAIGRWRTELGGVAIDSSGTTPTGEKLDGPASLKKHLLVRHDDFIRNVTEKMLSYALGRGLESYDLPAVRKITRALDADNYRSETLIREIVKSYPFQYRMGDPG